MYTVATDKNHHADALAGYIKQALASDNVGDFPIAHILRLTKCAGICVITITLSHL